MNVSQNGAIWSTPDLSLFFVEPRLNRRQSYHDIAGLALQIRQLGQLDPIKCFIHPDSTAEKQTYVVEDGMRRLAAFTLLREEGYTGEIRFELTVVDPSLSTYAQIVDDRLAKLVSYNDGEKFTLLEEAAIYKEFQTAGYSMTDIAAMVGTSIQHISQMLPLNDLSDEVKAHIADGTVSPSLAAEVIKGSESIDKANETIGAAAAAAKAEGGTGTVGRNDVAGSVDKKVSLNRLIVFKEYLANDPVLSAVVDTAVLFLRGTVTVEEAMAQIKAIVPAFEEAVPTSVLQKAENETKKAAEKLAKKVTDAGKLAEVAQAILKEAQDNLTDSLNNAKTVAKAETLAKKGEKYVAKVAKQLENYNKITKMPEEGATHRQAIEGVIAALGPVVEATNANIETVKNAVAAAEAAKKAEAFAATVKPEAGALASAAPQSKEAIKAAEEARKAAKKGAAK